MTLVSATWESFLGTPNSMGPFGVLVEWWREGENESLIGVGLQMQE